ncbi:hypothetical protein [Profundibacter sp.]
MSEENEGGLFTCPVMSWIVGALLGFATYLIMSGRYEYGTVASIIAALVVLVAFGILFQRLFCQGVTSLDSHPEPEVHEVAVDPVAVAEIENINPADMAMPFGIPETTSGEAKPGSITKIVSEAHTDTDESVAKDDAGKTADAPAAKPETAPKAKTEAAAKPKATAKPKAAAKPAAKKQATKTTTKPARKPVAADGKPEFLKKPRAGGADDLKQIKGVGPKLEQMLNKMGVFHFDQIAGWRAKEVKWVDENLEGFKGRVSRDEWVKQAKVLAKGGKTEFSKKVEKGGVYAKNKK